MVPKLGNAVDHLATSKVHLDSVYAGTAPAPTYILALAAAEAAVSTAQDMHAIRLLVEERYGSLFRRR